MLIKKTFEELLFWISYQIIRRHKLASMRADVSYLVGLIAQLEVELKVY